MKREMFAPSKFNLVLSMRLCVRCCPKPRRKYPGETSTPEPFPSSNSLILQIALLLWDAVVVAECGGDSGGRERSTDEGEPTLTATSRPSNLSAGVWISPFHFTTLARNVCLSVLWRSSMSWGYPLWGLWLLSDVLQDVLWESYWSLMGGLTRSLTMELTRGNSTALYVITVDTSY